MSVVHGSVIELDIDSQPYGPDSLGRVEGMAVFVGGAVPGDRVRAQVTEVRSRYARAKVTEIVSASPSRVPCDCPVADRCGGCQWQPFAYDRQLHAKRQAVYDSLVRIGGWENPPVGEIVPSPRLWNYRNRASYATESRGGHFRAGYKAWRSHDLVPIRTCPLNMPEFDKVLAEMMDILGTGPGARTARAIHTIAARQSERTGEILVRLTVDRKTRLRPMAEMLVERCGEVVGVVTNMPGKRQRPHDRVVLGRSSMIERVGGWSYRVSSSSFFQVNPFVTPELVRIVMDAARPSAGDTAVDAYGGVGLFSVPLAETGARVHLIESDASATADARRTLIRNRVRNTVVHREAVGASSTKNQRADVVVCDPPRSGAGADAMHALIRMQPSRFVYVACDPAALARDSVVLRESGYQLASATPLDMFPHTFHVETVALFEL